MIATLIQCIDDTTLMQCIENINSRWVNAVNTLPATILGNEMINNKYLLSHFD